MPPLALKLAAYAWPVVPEGKLVVVIASGLGAFEVGGELIAMASCPVAVCAAESVTWTLKSKLPGVVGVPLIAPVAAPSISPGGSAPALMAQL